MDAATRGSDFLEHYGVKGMKWGVRRSSSEISGSRGAFKRSKPDPSEDKQVANTYKAKVSKGNTDALSNKELKKLTERMQLEQTYTNLSAKQQARGKSFVQKTMDGDRALLKQGKYKETTTYQTGKFASAAFKFGKNANNMRKQRRAQNPNSQVVTRM